MPTQRCDTDRLVLRAIRGEERPSREEAQELPRLDLVGAAIARAARLAAADHRARVPHLGLANTQAAGLLRPTQGEKKALLDGLEPSDGDEGRLIDPASIPGSTPAASGPRFVWRLHPAPEQAGPRLASSTTDTRSGATA